MKEIKIMKNESEKKVESKYEYMMKKDRDEKRSGKNKVRKYKKNI